MGEIREVEKRASLLVSVVEVVAVAEKRRWKKRMLFVDTCLPCDSDWRRILYL